MTTIAQELGSFVAGLSADDLPEPVARAAVLHAVDTLGCGLAGYALGEGDYAAAAVTETPSAGPATAIGVRGGLPALDAVLVNGVLCHVLDFDDTHPDAVVHVNATITPAVLAMAQAFPVPGSTVLAALVAGNETSIRVGAAAPGRFHARGFHPTGVAGVFGAAAAAARIRGLDATRTTHALAIAGSMASGLLEFLSDGAQTKPLHPGWAAHAGICAARFAAHGATGPARVFEGSRGYFATYLHGEDTDMPAQVADLGSRWETPRIAYKAYPSCHYTHAPIDALAEIMRRSGLRPDDVERIVAFTDDTGVGLVLEPVADKLTPRTPYDSKFSLPYCLATQLVRGGVDVMSFGANRIDDPAVLALTPLVDYELRRYNPDGDSFGGGVRVRTKEGRILEVELPHQRGGAENPMTDLDVLGKFRTNAGLALAEEEVRTLESTLLTLASAEDLRGISVLARARRSTAGAGEDAPAAGARTPEAVGPLAS